MKTTAPTLDDIEAAARRIAPHAHCTPVMRSSCLDELTGASLFFKCENLQKVGAFKFRGACNTLLSLTGGDARHGVATHSSGNHGAAVSLAARLRGCHATVVMPRDANEAKKAAVRFYGGEIVECERGDEARERALAEVVAHTGATVVHPFDDYRVIAGQGTASLELVRELPDLDMVLAPVGGGGLLGGSSIAVKAVAPGIRVVGVEPDGARDTFLSYRAGRIIPVEEPATVADGLLTTVGRLTFPIIRQHVDDIVTVGDPAILEAMRLVWARMKLVVEPSGAVPLAAVLQGRIPVEGKRVGILISGGNVDLDALPWVRRSR